MSQSNVQSILDQIEQLPEADRLLLEQRLAELAETEWKREADVARRLARERGVDQAAIDQAIRDLCRGRAVGASERTRSLETRTGIVGGGPL